MLQLGHCRLADAELVGELQLGEARLSASGAEDRSGIVHYYYL
ncbi:MAG: hypothetical protein WA484_01510 [Solirubrobacteraceae bacterium]